MEPQTPTPHEHNEHPHHEPARKSFFEKYQVFIAIVTLAVLVVAALLIVHFVPMNNSSGQEQTEPTYTQAQVRDQLAKIAKKIGIDKTEFLACLDNGTEKAKIAADVTLAQNSGVQGTPTFFILKRTFDASGNVTSTKQFEILGARDETTFENAITSDQAPSDQPPQPAGQKIVLSPTDHWQGPKNAPIVIVEYADIDCPFCKAEYPVIADIMKNNPTYALVFRQSPIVQLHPWAEYKAEGSECAYDQGGDPAFWKYLSLTLGTPVATN